LRGAAVSIITPRVSCRNRSGRKDIQGQGSTLIRTPRESILDAKDAPRSRSWSTWATRGIPAERFHGESRYDTSGCRFQKKRPNCSTFPRRTASWGTRRNVAVAQTRFASSGVHSLSRAASRTALSSTLSLGQRASRLRVPAVCSLFDPFAPGDCLILATLAD
jgi:hypothetical protein